MTSRLRKLGFVAHIASSVGWIGAVVTFLALSIAGLFSQNTVTVRGAYLAMNLIGEFVIVPLSLAALATGLIQALGTEWGLFRYYWVLVKFVLTIGSTLLLLLHQFTAVAEASKRVLGESSGTLPSTGRLGVQLVIDASLAILVLLIATTLSVFKPWGKIGLGGRRQEDNGPGTAGATLDSHGLPLPFKAFLVVTCLGLAALVVWHLKKGGMGHHGP